MIVATVIQARNSEILTHIGDKCISNLFKIKPSVQIIEMNRDTHETIQGLHKNPNFSTLISFIPSQEYIDLVNSTLNTVTRGASTTAFKLYFNEFSPSTTIRCSAVCRSEILKHKKKKDENIFPIIIISRMGYSNFIPCRVVEVDELFQNWNFLWKKSWYPPEKKIHFPLENSTFF